MELGRVSFQLLGQALVGALKGTFCEEKKVEPGESWRGAREKRRLCYGGEVCVWGGSFRGIDWGSRMSGS